MLVATAARMNQKRNAAIRTPTVAKYVFAAARSTLCTCSDSGPVTTRRPRSNFKARLLALCSSGSHLPRDGNGHSVRCASFPRMFTQLMPVVDVQGFDNRGSGQVPLERVNHPNTHVAPLPKTISVAAR